MDAEEFVCPTCERYLIRLSSTIAYHYERLGCPLDLVMENEPFALTGISKGSFFSLLFLFLGKRDPPLFYAGCSLFPSFEYRGHYVMVQKRGR